MTATTTPTAVDPRVGLAFKHREHSQTTWLCIEYPTDAEPTALFDALRAIGWSDDHRWTAPLPPVAARDWGTPDPVAGTPWTDLGYMIGSIDFMKDGSDVFGGWTDDEKRSFLPAARAVLRRFGFTRVPNYALTLADLL
jgi:hypothetical protein